MGKGAHGMTLQEVEARLREAGIDAASVEALGLAKNFTSLGEIALRAGESFDSAPLEAALARRCERYPLQYLLGEWPFWRQSYEVTPDALIPRADTESLVEEAIRRLPRGAHFADLCTGSGCIAVSVLAERPDTTAVAVDKFPATLALAERNAKRNAVDARFVPVMADLLLPGTAVEGMPFDAVLCNPPYIRSEVIPTLERELFAEPMAALDGGEDGLIFYRTLLADADRWIKKDGFFLFEIGYDQGDALLTLARENGFSDVCVLRDLGGCDRVVYAARARGIN